MTNKKICPFSMSGTGGNNTTFPYPQRCIEEKCMAWMPANEWLHHDDGYTVSGTNEGRCKLIPK